MNFEYIILSSDYTIAAEYAKQHGLVFGQWDWIRDKFAAPVMYKRVDKDGD